MISRYSREVMSRIWNQERRFQHMLEVEKTVAEVQASLRIIPRPAAEAIRKKGKFQIDRILEIERTTKHDVIAFVSNVAENVGEHGKFVHFGMTSSDVLDTALSLQILSAFDELAKSMQRLKKVLLKKIRAEATTLCSGRTHGMHAEPTSFGLKLAGFYEEIERNEERLARAREEIRICKLSGAVGTYSSQPPEVERGVAKRLGLRAGTLCTQVVPRDRHAEVFTALSLLGGAIERLSIEMRHLQRTEVGEVVEGFTPGQKGSSAMPHKKNPISGENLTGLARLLRSYALAGLENIALWHERDISHSSVERVVFPDAFILADYAISRLADLIDGLYVDRKKMLENMQQSHGQLFSSHFLLLLVQKGLSREEAYKIVQELSHVKPQESLLKKALQDVRVKKLATKKELEKVFSGGTHKERIQELIRKWLKERR